MSSPYAVCAFGIQVLNTASAQSSLVCEMRRSSSGLGPEGFFRPVGGDGPSDPTGSASACSARPTVCTRLPFPRCQGLLSARLRSD
ncbi:hypothetical protein Acsp04_42200 [Actinomadura sp. NBRC 104425]|nr:hypothetical protein Acsp04_42200 [Actinomadura sp. NBRC 104425]